MLGYNPETSPDRPLTHEEKMERHIASIDHRLGCCMAMLVIVAAAAAFMLLGLFRLSSTP